jgi:hypothetical protein
MEGNSFRILESKTAKKENHPVPKRRNLGFALVSRSENHLVNLLVKDKQFATPPREGKGNNNEKTKKNLCQYHRLAHHQ